MGQIESSLSSKGLKTRSWSSRIFYGIAALKLPKSKTVFKNSSSLYILVNGKQSYIQDGQNHWFVRKFLQVESFLVTYGRHFKWTVSLQLAHVSLYAWGSKRLQHNLQFAIIRIICNYEKAGNFIRDWYDFKSIVTLEQYNLWDTYNKIVKIRCKQHIKYFNNHKVKK